jgi:hypothetical protein
MFKAIEVDATSHQRTGRELALEAETRQAAIDTLLLQLGVAPGSAIVDPSRTMVRLGDRLWTLVSVAAANEPTDASASLRRAGAKHKRVR